MSKIRLPLNVCTRQSPRATYTGAVTLYGTVLCTLHAFNAVLFIFIGYLYFICSLHLFFLVLSFMYLLFYLFSCVFFFFFSSPLPILFSMYLFVFFRFCDPQLNAFTVLNVHFVVVCVCGVLGLTLINIKTMQWYIGNEK